MSTIKIYPQSNCLVFIFLSFTISLKAFDPPLIYVRYTVHIFFGACFVFFFTSLKFRHRRWGKLLTNLVWNSARIRYTSKHTGKLFMSVSIMPSVGKTPKISRVTKISLSCKNNNATMSISTFKSKYGLAGLNSSFLTYALALCHPS